MIRSFPVAAFALALLIVFTATAADTESYLRQHEDYLASPARDGRGIGTPGLDSAAAYIAAQMKSIGLVPAFDGTYFQPFEMGWGVTLGPNNKVTRGTTTLDTVSGIMPIGFSSPGTVRAPVVFAGYGITAPEYNYDDFAGVDVTGAIVLCLTAEPGEYDTASVFEGINYTTHSGMRAKAQNAKLKGAAAILLVEGPLYHDKEKDILHGPRADEPYMDCGIPALRITREAVYRLFPDFDLASVQKFIDSKTAPRSLALKADTLDVSVDLTRHSVMVKNVVGILPGDTSVIVVGAHYDHLGYGQSGSLDPKPGKVHPGADDNASGVSSILETARILKQKPVHETVMFCAFTGEETGLNGSGYITKHFPGGISHVRAMLNLDMVGRMQNNKLTITGCKTAEQFAQLVDEANKPVGIDVTCKGDGYGPSDHMNFYLADKPVLFFFTGAHADYHKSTDTPDKIDYKDMVRIVDLTVNLVRGLDNFSPPLVFVKSAEPKEKSSGGRFRSSFGSIPDFSQPDSLKGVLLSGVRDSSAAALAGVQKGDLVIRMGKVAITNLYDLVYALQIYAPGDTVEVAYKRAGEEKTTKAIMQQSNR